MTAFAEYSQKYTTVAMERRNGILQMRLHTEGKALRWGALPHEELPAAFYDVGRDRDNKVVILTGTGNEFSGPKPTPETGFFPTRPPALAWDKIYWEGKHLLMNLLNIEVPMIGAVNGPALRHSELPLLCDIVLAAEDASFQDAGHFGGGLVPGDGVHVIYPHERNWREREEQWGDRREGRGCPPGLAKQGPSARRRPSPTRGPSAASGASTRAATARTPAPGSAMSVRRGGSKSQDHDARRHSVGVT